MEKIITDEKSLKEVSHYLHDAIIKNGNFKYDPSQKKFVMEIEREKWEDSNNKRIIFFKKHKKTWQKCKLVFDDILSYTEKMDEMHEQYVLSSMEFDSGDSIIKIFTAYGMVIYIKVLKLNGVLLEGIRI
ncbi:MAG: DUF2948 family protein [Candidatus Omnitrophota bacterium]